MLLLYHQPHNLSGSQSNPHFSHLNSWIHMLACHRVPRSDLLPLQGTLLNLLVFKHPQSHLRCRDIRLRPLLPLLFAIVMPHSRLTFLAKICLSSHGLQVLLHTMKRFLTSLINHTGPHRLSLRSTFLRRASKELVSDKSHLVLRNISTVLPTYRGEKVRAHLSSHLRLKVAMPLRNISMNSLSVLRRVQNTLLLLLLLPRPMDCLHHLAISKWVHFADLRPSHLPGT